MTVASIPAFDDHSLKIINDANYEDKVHVSISFNRASYIYSVSSGNIHFQVVDGVIASSQSKKYHGLTIERALDFSKHNTKFYCEKWGILTESLNNAQNLDSISYPVWTGLEMNMFDLIMCSSTISDLARGITMKVTGRKGKHCTKHSDWKIGLETFVAFRDKQYDATFGKLSRCNLITEFQEFKR